jgi:hypothetical protein
MQSDESTEQQYEPRRHQSQQLDGNVSRHETKAARQCHDCTEPTRPAPCAGPVFTKCAIPAPSQDDEERFMSEEGGNAGCTDA